MEDKYVPRHFLFHNTLRRSIAIKYLGTSVTDQNFSHKELNIIKFWECFILFCSETFTFPSSIQGIGDWNTRTDFNGCKLWVWKLVLRPEGRLHTEIVWEYRAEENIWANEQSLKYYVPRSFIICIQYYKRHTCLSCRRICLVASILFVDPEESTYFFTSKIYLTHSLAKKGKQTSTQNTMAVRTGTKVKSALKESIMQDPATKATESAQ